jgi:alpha-tubulin suppressor-like RCC1 family protein
MGDQLPVVNLGTGRFAVEISAGESHVCARLDNGRVKCWGNGIALGLGDTSDRGFFADELGDNLPYLDLGANRTAVAIYAGWARTCAKLDNGETKCWGFESSSGALGMGTKNGVRGTTPQTVPANLTALDLGSGRTTAKIAHGFQHVCAILDNNQTKCWGGGSGVLGLGDTFVRGDEPNEMGDNLPALNLGTGRTAVTIAAGGSRSCAILDNGDLKCWGFQGSPGLGYGDTYAGNNVGDALNETGDSLVAINLGTNLQALEVVGGFHHLCARLTNGQIKCWGTNSSGQLGLGDTATRGDQIAEMGDNLPAVDLGQ